MKSIEHYWSWACERWILRFVLYLCVLCFTSVPPAIPGNQSPHPVWGLLWLKCRLAWYCTTQQSLVSEGAVNGLCMWSWKMNNNMESVLSAGKAEAKEPEGCFYILDHQPFFFCFKNNDECNLMLVSSFAPTAKMNLFVSLLTLLLTLRSNSADKRSLALEMEMKQHPVKLRWTKLKMSQQILQICGI